MEQNMETEKRREGQQKEGKHAVNPDPGRKDRDKEQKGPGGNPDRDREQEKRAKERNR